MSAADTDGDNTDDVTLKYDALGRRIAKTAGTNAVVYVSATQPIQFRLVHHKKTTRADNLGLDDRWSRMRRVPSASGWSDTRESSGRDWKSWPSRDDIRFVFTSILNSPSAFVLASPARGGARIATSALHCAASPATFEVQHQRVDVPFKFAVLEPKKMEIAASVAVVQDHESQVANRWTELPNQGCFVSAARELLSCDFPAECRHASSQTAPRGAAAIW